MTVLAYCIKSIHNVYDSNHIVSTVSVMPALILMCHVFYFGDVAACEMLFAVMVFEWETLIGQWT